LEDIARGIYPKRQGNNIKLLFSSMLMLLKIYEKIGMEVPADLR
jgi:hypothetical protein